MSWKERRLISILGAILGVLVIALLIVLGIRFRKNRDVPDASSSSAVTAGESQSGWNDLSYSNGSTTLAFHKGEDGNWFWVHDDGFPLDDGTVTTILDTLETMAPQQTLTAPESLETYGLTEPRATITATAAEGTVISMAFGNTTTDGNSYYALLNGDLTTVYIYPGTLMELMSVPVYDMCLLPELPQLTEDRLQKITIQGAPPEDGSDPLRLSLTSYQSEGITTWRAEGANVTDAPRVRGLMEDLAALKIEKCVDYRPSNEALSICGFDAPAATLWTNYTTATDLEGHLKMTVGGLTLDGAARYVRLNDEKTIYRVPTDLLDPLMVIALSGLEG